MLVDRGVSVYYLPLQLLYNHRCYSTLVYWRMGVWGKEYLSGQLLDSSMIREEYQVQKESSMSCTTCYTIHHTILLTLHWLVVVYPYYSLLTIPYLHYNVVEYYNTMYNDTTYTYVYRQVCIMILCYTISTLLATSYTSICTTLQQFCTTYTTNTQMYVLYQVVYLHIYYYYVWWYPIDTSIVQCNQYGYTYVQ